MDAIDLLAVISDWKPHQPLAHGTIFSYNGGVFRVAQVNEMACTNCHFYSADDLVCRPFDNLPDCGSCIFVEVSL